MFRFGDLQLRSALALPGVHPGGPQDVGAPEIHIAFAPLAPPEGREVYRWQGRYALALEALDHGWLIRFSREGGIRVSADATALTCLCADPAQHDLMMDILMRRVLPRLSGLHGQLPLHAASLGDARGALMLFGASGAGKSTLTAALAQRLGWNVFSDDMSVVSSPAAMAGAVSTRVALWQAALTGLDLPPGDCRPMAGYDGKIWYTPARPPDSAPRPLKALIFLSRDSAGDALTMRPLSGPQVLIMAASQLVRFNPPDAAEAGRLMERLKALVASVPAWGLGYPSGYDRLGEVTNLLGEFLANAPSRPL